MPVAVTSSHPFRGRGPRGGGSSRLRRRELALRRPVFLHPAGTRHIRERTLSSRSGIGDPAGGARRRPRPQEEVIELRKKSRTLMPALLLLILFIALVAPGCAKKEAAEEEAERAVSEEEAPPAAAEERAAEAERERPEGTEAEETEEAEEAMPFASGTQSLGSGWAADMVISDVRWADHGTYFRIVFELRKSDGTEATSLPATQAYPANSEGSELNIFFLGAGVTDSRFRNESDSVSVAHPLITRIGRTVGGGSGETTFKVTATAPIRYYLHRVTGPLRVILDIER